MEKGWTRTDDAGERRVEEIRVLVNTRLELRVALVGEQLQVILILGLAEIVQILEATQHEIVIVAGDIQVASGRGSVALVFVVRTGDSLRLAEEVEGDGDATVGPADGPAYEVAIDGSAVDREQSGEIDAHTEDCLLSASSDDSNLAPDYLPLPVPSMN